MELAPRANSCSVLPPSKSLPVLQSSVCHFPSLLLIHQTRGLPFCTASIQAKGCNPLPVVTPARATLSHCRHNCVKLMPSQKKTSPCLSAISSVPGFENEHLLLRAEAAQICQRCQHLHGCSRGSPRVPRVCLSMNVSFAAQTGGWGQRAAKGTCIVVGCTSMSQPGPDQDQSLPGSAL